MEKLYISEELIKEKGYAYFFDEDIEIYKSFATDEFKMVDDFYVSRDDMYNIYLSLKEDDQCFTDYEDIRDICEKAAQEMDKV